MTSTPLKEEIEKLVTSGICEKDVAEMVTERLVQGNLTRDEGNKEHFCVYFAAFDPAAREVFIGHHKKSDLWLFNGGHIDKGENLRAALGREMNEEWGLDQGDFKINDPSLLTVTPINSLPQPLCKTHYDIWYCIPVIKKEFNPNEEKLGKEFFETRWVGLEAVKKLVTEKNTLRALKIIAKNFG